MKAPDWYDAWCEEAFATFTAKQKRMDETHRLAAWARYDYDAAACTLTFSDEAGPRVVADIQVVGTIGGQDWMWGWANGNWPAQSTEAMRQVRQFGLDNGIEELATDVLTSDDLPGLGWMLAAISARVLEAEGAYRAPSGAGAVYLLIRSLKSVS
ncbi:MAG: hypothetical protein A2790_16885 [Phenylobacterium sp. RIFCSPHIGHO2_01_FULL_69_31]|uniref:DUF6882 domain-containing protein n=1 Tax=Phenylobacterium sp. RIFCSPHIGHO2_01_FULL_69_31 TaxID=1801944 RepID=UPI0008B9DDEA|nr:DUF6882 domain-containing protein [Phenylobacterium sp. RIFCSPHIGHO2_01_FULL_69_31]OHB27699.1 MAG: hypothetical protein A2790_16885 [Phenylobacterium sp. RIFCSPHIGHO2_01_FULL_69_31]